MVDVGFYGFIFEWYSEDLTVMHLLMLAGGGSLYSQSCVNILLAGFSLIGISQPAWAERSY